MLEKYAWEENGFYPASNDAFSQSYTIYSRLQVFRFLQKWFYWFCDKTLKNSKCLFLFPSEYILSKYGKQHSNMWISMTWSDLTENNWSAAEYRYTYMIYFVRQDWYIKRLWFCHILNLIILALFILINKTDQRIEETLIWTGDQLLTIYHFHPWNLVG